MLKDSRLFQIVWTLLSLASAFLIWALTVASAAWNGVNLAVGLYLITSSAGTLGLLAGLCTGSSRARLFDWMNCFSATAMALLSTIYLAGFIFDRDPGVPIGDVIYVNGVPSPLIVIYAAAIIFCSVQALLSARRLREREI